MQYVVLKLGPNSLAVYGPYSADQAHNRAASLNDGGTEWSASVQPLYPDT